MGTGRGERAGTRPRRCRGAGGPGGRRRWAGGGVKRRGGHCAGVAVASAEGGGKGGRGWREWEEAVGRARGALMREDGRVQAHRERADPSAPADSEVSPVDSRCFPRLAVQICKTFGECFLSPGLRESEGWLVFGRGESRSPLTV